MLEKAEGGTLSLRVASQLRNLLPHAGWHPPEWQEVEGVNLLLPRRDCKCCLSRGRYGCVSITSLVFSQLYIAFHLSQRDESYTVLWFQTLSGIFSYFVGDHKTAAVGKQCYLVFSGEENKLFRAYLSRYRSLITLGTAERDIDPVFPVSRSKVAVFNAESQKPRLKMSFSAVAKILNRTYHRGLPGTEKRMSSRISRYSIWMNISEQGPDSDKCSKVSQALAHSRETAARLEGAKLIREAGRNRVGIM